MSDVPIEKPEPPADKFLDQLNQLARDEFDRQKREGIETDQAIISVTHGLLSVAVVVMSTAPWQEPEWITLAREVWRDITLMRRGN